MLGQNEKSKQNFTAYLLLGLTLLILTRLLPLLKAPLSAFAYDYGFYFDAAKNAHSLNWQALLTALRGGFNNPLFYFFNLLRIPPELSLTLSYLIFTLLLGLSLFWLLSKFDVKAGLFALVLYSLSLVQMESYLMFLYKSALALPFMLLGFKFLMETDKKILIPEQSRRVKIFAFDKLRQQTFRYWPFILCTLIITLTHRTTTIIYLLSIGFYLLWLLIKNQKWKILISFGVLSALLLTTGYLLLDLRSIILNLIANSNYYVRTGLFLPFDNPWSLVWPYLLMAILGLSLYLQHKQNTLPIFFTGVCLLWLLFKFPFYRRLWIYFDLALIIFAAYFLSAAIAKNRFPKSVVIIMVMVIVSFLAYRAVNFTLAKSPLVAPPEIAEIENFREPPGFILAVSANDAPWLLAYADEKQRLGAPGLLEDPHTYPQWLDFWNGQKSRQFVSKYPRPLYLYQRTWHLPAFGLAACLQPLSPNFSEVDYNCIEKTPN